jgi:hypothetical protein
MQADAGRIGLCIGQQARGLVGTASGVGNSVETHHHFPISHSQPQTMPPYVSAAGVLSHRAVATSGKRLLRVVAPTVPMGVLDTVADARRLLRRPLQPDELVETARRRIGPNDFGGVDFTKPLQRAPSAQPDRPDYQALIETRRAYHFRDERGAGLFHPHPFTPSVHALASDSETGSAPAHVAVNPNSPWQL